MIKVNQHKTEYEADRSQLFNQGRGCTAGLTSPELQLPQGMDQLRQIEINANLEDISFFLFVGLFELEFYSSGNTHIYPSFKSG